MHGLVDLVTADNFSVALLAAIYRTWPATASMPCPHQNAAHLVGLLPAVMQVLRPSVSLSLA
jgi:hypothetical protein